MILWPHGSDFCKGYEPSLKVDQTKLGNKEVTGAVDQAVGEMLTNYLEENPNMAKQIVQKILLAAQARNAARKAREMVQRKNVLSALDFLVSWPTVQTKTPKSARFFLSREIRREVMLNKEGTDFFSLYYH